MDRKKPVSQKEAVEWWRGTRQALAANPRSWLWMASSFSRAAELCWEAYEREREELRNLAPGGVRVTEHDDLALQRVAYYLASHCIELLAKGILISAEPGHLNERRLYSHSLPELVKWAGVVSDDDDESRLLGRLSDCLQWVGRYPVPRWDDEKGRKKYDVRVKPTRTGFAVDGRSIPGPWGDEDWPGVQRLTDRLTSALRKVASIRGEEES